MGSHPGWVKRGLAVIYKSVADRLRIRVNGADCRVGDVLPSEKTLASQFGVSRMTVRKAVDMLIEWGLVERRHGSGTYVTKKDVQHETKGLSGFTELMREQGRSLTSEVLEFRTMPAPPAIASQLRIKVNEPVYFSNRVRSVDGRALLVEESYMPVRLFRTLSVAHLEGSKFAYIENECQLPIAGNYESFSAVLADRRMAELLHIEQGAPILRLTSLSYGENGEFLNYSIMFRNANDYHVDYHLRRARG